MRPKDIVKKYYPFAKCIKRLKGKKYFEIYWFNTYLGQGKTEIQAWKSAYNNITD